jgi:uncharacterized membrane protein
MITSIVQLFAIFLVPVLIIKYHNFILTKWLGTIGTAYAAGIVVALIIYGLNSLGLNIVVSTDIGEIGSHLSISIAIPLLLFSANLAEARKLSKTVLKSFGSLIFSAVVVSTIVFYIYAKNMENGAVLSGMAIGLYTGGVPNLNAIGNIFGLEGTIISSANLSDMIIGAFFYIFLLLLCKPLLLKFMRPSDNDIYITDKSNMMNTDDLDLATFKITKKLISRVLIAFGMTLIGAVFGILVWIILGMQDGRMIDILVPTLMISVTALGIAGSFNKKIRETKGMNVAGQYFILVFSFALASGMDFSQLQEVIGSTIILYGAITLGVFIMHVIISKFLNIDADCTMVTLTAGLYGPAFVPAITNQIKNDDLTVPGLITGSVGYAIGTFLGMLLVFLYLV